uniref:Uncharacterized protein n=1 Tax=Neolamprologus brichardi TaxID=32507 RepID=A0A3Q4HDZ3_NEOBR
ASAMAAPSFPSDHTYITQKHHMGKTGDSLYWIIPLAIVLLALIVAVIVFFLCKKYRKLRHSIIKAQRTYNKIGKYCFATKLPKKLHSTLNYLENNVSPSCKTPEVMHFVK